MDNEMQKRLSVVEKINNLSEDELLEFIEKLKAAFQEDKASA